MQVKSFPPLTAESYAPKEAQIAVDPRAFSAFEREAHDRLADHYTTTFAPLTSLALPALFDAAVVKQGDTLLDVGTGPGIAAAMAQSHGANVTGIDVSPRMIALAAHTLPKILFHTGDVNALPFPDASFDVVISNFGLGHFPEPELALAQCVRLLVPGGRLAFSWWDEPIRQRVQGLFREAIMELGLSPPHNVPQGHNVFRFSKASEFVELLTAASLASVSVTTHQTTHRFSDIEALWQAGMGGLAVTAASIAAQDAVTQTKVRDVIARRATIYQSSLGLKIPISFLIGSGIRP